MPTQALKFPASKEPETSPGYVFGPQGCAILRDLSKDEFRRALGEAQDRADSGTWGLGDLLVYGKRRGDWGSFYEEAMKETGLAYNTLSHKAVCSREWPLEERIPGASWSSHYAVLSLPKEKQKPALQIAQRKGWGAAKLSAWVATQNRRPSVKGEQNRGPRPVVRRTMRCPNCKHEWQPHREDWVGSKVPRHGRQKRGRPRE